MINVTHRRERRIEVLKRRLLKKSHPRIHASIIVGLTALAGFVTSFTLLHAGVQPMWLRYPMSIIVAYCFFLLLLALWLWLHRRSLDLDVEVLDVVQYSSESTTDYSIGDGGGFGGGGDFGGAGAGGSWGSSMNMSSAVTSSNQSSGPSFGFGLDLEEGWFVVLALVAILAGLIASLYVVYIAPVLLAEILVDGVLVAGLYKRVKHIDQRHWLRTAVQRTILPAILAVLFFGIAGYALQRAVPEAHTIGEVWREMMK